MIFHMVSFIVPGGWPLHIVEREDRHQRVIVHRIKFRGPRAEVLLTLYDFPLDIAQDHTIDVQADSVEAAVIAAASEAFEETIYLYTHQTA